MIRVVGIVQAAAVEPPADLLQGEQSSGRRSSEQPERVDDAVLEAAENDEPHKPGHTLHDDDDL